MKPSQYKELENNKSFKRYYLNKTLWWINYLFVAPALLLFIGLAGIMHMGYSDRLWSWYAIPYIAVFLIGTIWLKAIKRHVQTKILEDRNMYLICAAQAIFEAEGRYYFIFSKDSKRHNEVLINKLAGELSKESFTRDEIQRAKKQMVEISTSEEETQIYLKGISVNKVNRANVRNIKEGITPLLYVSSKEIFVVRNKDLK